MILVTGAFWRLSSKLNRGPSRNPTSVGARTDLREPTLEIPMQQYDNLCHTNIINTSKRQGGLSARKGRRTIPRIWSGLDGSRLYQGSESTLARRQSLKADTVVSKANLGNPCTAVWSHVQYT